MKDGKSAHTHVEPLMIVGKKTKIKAVIKTGRTHQIRVHLAAIDYPIVGDTQYGHQESSKAKRVLLHAKKIKLLDYEFECEDSGDFKALGF